MEVLTRSQERRTTNAVLAILTRLVNARQRKELIKDILLGAYPDAGEDGSWGKLWLTSLGLVEQTGYWDRCICPSDCMGDHKNREGPRNNVKPNMRIVRDYGLKAKPLETLLQKLKA